MKQLSLYFTKALAGRSGSGRALSFSGLFPDRDIAARNTVHRASSARTVAVWMLGVLLWMAFGAEAYGQRFAVATGNWTDAIWATTAGGMAGTAATPKAADAVTINGNVTVTVNISNAECSSMAINPTNNNQTGTLSFASGSVLDVVNGVTIGGTGNRRGSINMGSGGTLKVGAGITIPT